MNDGGYHFYPGSPFPFKACVPHTRRALFTSEPSELELGQGADDRMEWKRGPQAPPLLKHPDPIYGKAHVIYLISLSSDEMGENSEYKFCNG